LPGSFQAIGFSIALYYGMNMLLTCPVFRTVDLSEFETNNPV